MITRYLIFCKEKAQQSLDIIGNYFTIQCVFKTFRTFPTTDRAGVRVDGRNGLVYNMPTQFTTLKEKSI